MGTSAVDCVWNLKMRNFKHHRHSERNRISSRTLSQTNLNGVEVNSAASLSSLGGSRKPNINTSLSA